MFLRCEIMTSITFTLHETSLGWYVTGHNKMGPFFSRQRALDLAEGMVSAINASGAEAILVIGPCGPFANPLAGEGLHLPKRWLPLLCATDPAVRGSV
jgi:hypothetical protein